MMTDLFSHSGEMTMRTNVVRFVSIVVMGHYLLHPVFCDEQKPAEDPRPAVDPKTAHADYKKWQPVGKPLLQTYPAVALCASSDFVGSGIHSDRFITTYVSPNSRELYLKNLLRPQDLSQTPEATAKPIRFPQGTVIVKEKRLKMYDMKPHELGIMIKQQSGFSPETGDWQYAFFDQDGEFILGKSLRHCAECHTRAKHDHVFGTKRATKLE